MKKQIDVLIPHVPNFIKVGTTMVSISEFSERELASIGKEWTRLLKERARLTKPPVAG